MRNRIILVLLALFLAGCGQEAADKPPPAPVPANPGVVAEPAPVAPVVAARPAVSPQPADRPAWSLDDQLREILWLEEDGAFSLAQRRCRKLKSAFAEAERHNELAPIINRLTEKKREVPELTFAAQTLAVDDASQAGVAKQRLLEAADTGRVALRLAVEREPDNVAKKALELLLELQDEGVAGACFQRIRAQPRTALRTLCRNHLREKTAQLATRLLPRIYKHAAASEDGQERDELIAVLRTRITGELDPQTLNHLRRRVMADDGVAELPLAGFFGLVYQARTRRIDEDFDNLFDVPDALADLRDYLTRAAGSGDPAVAGRAKSLAAAMTSQDYDRLAVARLDAPLVATPDVESAGGRGVNVDEEHLVQVRSSPELIGLQRESYSVSIWLNPAELPPGKQPGTFRGVLRKPDWQMGLVIDRDGTPCHLHFLKDGPTAVIAKAPASLESGRWTHVAVSLNRDIGAAVLYVDGKQVSSAAFEPRAETAEEVEAQLVNAALGMPEEATAQPFSGRIDDLRFYARALPEPDIKALYSLGQGWE